MTTSLDAGARKYAAKKGFALADGSYPIMNGTDLLNAIKTVGLGKAPQATIKAHIVKRAKALNLTKMLPAGWA